MFRLSGKTLGIFLRFCDALKCEYDAIYTLLYLNYKILKVLALLCLKIGFKTGNATV